MRILYFSDGYGSSVMGTKRSIFEELKTRGIDAVFQNKSNIGKVSELVKTLDPDQVWLAHSSLVLPCDKSMIKKPVVGFGFSDPHYFSDTRLRSYDIYITNHYGTYLEYRDSMPVHHNPTACNVRFHKNLALKRDIDISCIGLGEHPWFKDKRERIVTVNRLREDLTYDIRAYGTKWPRHDIKNFGHIEGDDFLNVINRSRIGLDIQDGFCPPSQRMFEYSACGTPVITREREDIGRLFEPEKEILTYDSYENLRDKLSYYLEDPFFRDKLKEIGLNAQARCIKDHDIKFRVNKILGFLEGALGG